ncbi:MAG: hypothetical protein LBS76_05085 [Mycoplasmataceae bacterium]|nr:hypothetical protein [Mycoplasmataceae bacterium]
MAKPVKYRVISFVDDIIVLECMTSDKRTHKPKSQPLREIVIEGFKAVNGRLDKVDTRLDNIATDVADLKVRMTNVETKVDSIDTRLSTVETTLTTVIKLNNLKTT